MPLALDPVVDWAIRALVAGVLGFAATAKLRDPDAFAAALAGYGLLPSWALGAAARGVAVAEAAAALALLAAPGKWGVLAGLALLCVVTAFAGAALARGRAGVACGCGGLGREPGLSKALLARNAGTITVLALALLPTGARTWTALDAFTAALALAGGLVAYAAVSQLIANRERMMLARRQRA